MSARTRLTQFLSPARLTLAGVGVAVVAGVAAALRPDAIEVETAPAARAPMRVTVDAEGRTRVRDRFVVAAPVAGRLERVRLAEGDAVRAGDVVARIAPAPLDEPTARQALARLAAARAQAAGAGDRLGVAAAADAQARRDVARTRRLVEAGAAAPRALEEAELAARARAGELAAARAQLTAARAEVAQAAAVVPVERGGAGGTVVVRAPAAGRVLRLAEPSERVVATGAAIAELADTRGLEVTADVLSTDAARVRPGMSVLLEGWGGPQPLRGRVRLVEPAAVTRVSALGVEEQRVDVVIDVTAPPAALGDGYRVDARIVVWERGDVLTVPAAALVRDGAGWAAFVVRDGRARRQPLAIGELGGGGAQVLGGVRAGERVVAFPSDKIRDGVRVAAP
jgi:HlyD family secretion protein